MSENEVERNGGQWKGVNNLESGQEFRLATASVTRVRYTDRYREIQMADINLHVKVTAVYDWNEVNNNDNHVYNSFTQPDRSDWKRPR